MTLPSHSNKEHKRIAGLQRQPIFLIFLVLLFSGAMISRLVWMQLIEGFHFKQLADENRIRLVPRSPIRGRLLDRKGRVLATNKLSYNLTYVGLLTEKPFYISSKFKIQM